ncbi:hypothetical protein SESBI_49992 [Sesbania bispinosa]|nr:hypothetical protein SESBI_49992 [Sesbania bispinosa]
MGDRSYFVAQDTFPSDPSNGTRSVNATNNDSELNWVREDMPPTIIERLSHVMHEMEYEEDSDYDDTLLDFFD